MSNIITLLQQIFIGKEDIHAHVGLSEFKAVSEPVKRFKKKSRKSPAPQQLRLSDLMRKSY